IPQPRSVEPARPRRPRRRRARRVGRDADQRRRAGPAKRANDPFLRDQGAGEPAGRPRHSRDLFLPALPPALVDQAAADGRRDAVRDHEGHAGADGRCAGAARRADPGRLAPPARPTAAARGPRDAARALWPRSHRLAGPRRRQGQQRTDHVATHSGGARRGAARRRQPSARPRRARGSGGGRGRAAGARETPAARAVVSSSAFHQPGAPMGSVILLILVAVIVIWMIGAYNGLISLKNQTLNAFKQIDVQLKRRHDLIPNLVNAVKGAMDFEKSTLEAVIQARNQAVKISAGAAGPEGMKQINQAENALSGALSRLMVVVEQYPQLKATGNIGQLQEELTSTENRIAFARQLYNDTATQYNTKQQQFPTTLVAGLAKAQTAELWETEDQAERAVPQVDLSMKPKA